MKVLDLCSGLGGFSQAFLDRGHEVITIDNESKFNPTICADVRTINANDFECIDVILASPPCQGFSVASIGKMWGGGHRKYIPIHPTSKMGLEIVQSILRLIQNINPEFWFMENPRGVLRKVHQLPEYTIWYCRYGETRAKPTDIWTNSKRWNPRPPCNNGNPDHERAPRGAKTGTQGIKNSALRAKIPYELSLEICKSCEPDAPFQSPYQDWGD